MDHLQITKPDPASQDHKIPLTYCKIACEATDMSLSISRRVVLEIGGSGTADDDALHLLFFGLDFVEHSLNSCITYNSISSVFAFFILQNFITTRLHHQIFHPHYFHSLYQSQVPCPQQLLPAHHLYISSHNLSMLRWSILQ